MQARRQAARQHKGLLRQQPEEHRRQQAEQHVMMRVRTRMPATTMRNTAQVSIVVLLYKGAGAIYLLKEVSGATGVLLAWACVD